MLLLESLIVLILLIFNIIVEVYLTQTDPIASLIGLSRSYPLHVSIVNLIGFLRG